MVLTLCKVRLGFREAVSEEKKFQNNELFADLNKNYSFAIQGSCLVFLAPKGVYILENHSQDHGLTDS